MADIKMDCFYKLEKLYNDFLSPTMIFFQYSYENIKDYETLSELFDDKYYDVYCEGGIIHDVRKEIEINLMLNYVEKKDYFERIYYYGIIRLLAEYEGSEPIYGCSIERNLGDVRWNNFLSMTKPIFQNNYRNLSSFAYEIHQIADGKGIFLHAPNLALNKIPELRLDVHTHNFLKFINKNEVDPFNTYGLDSPTPYDSEFAGVELVLKPNHNLLGANYDTNEEKDSNSGIVTYNVFDLTPTHRSIIFAHNFKAEAGIAEPITTKEGWRMHGNRNGVSGNNRTNQWYTTIPRNKDSYDPPRPNEIHTILHLLLNEPQALETAKRGIIRLLKDYPDRMEQAKEIISEY